MESGCGMRGRMRAPERGSGMASSRVTRFGASILLCLTLGVATAPVAAASQGLTAAPAGVAGNAAPHLPGGVTGIPVTGDQPAQSKPWHEPRAGGASPAVGGYSIQGTVSAQGGGALSGIYVEADSMTSGAYRLRLDVRRRFVHDLRPRLRHLLHLVHRSERLLLRRPLQWRRGTGHAFDSRTRDDHEFVDRRYQRATRRDRRLDSDDSGERAVGRCGRAGGIHRDRQL